VRLVQGGSRCFVSKYAQLLNIFAHNKLAAKERVVKENWQLTIFNWSDRFFASRRHTDIVCGVKNLTGLNQCLSNSKKATRLNGIQPKAKLLVK
jgi:hypothetical protein